MLGTESPISCDDWKEDKCIRQMDYHLNGSIYHPRSMVMLKHYIISRIGFDSQTFPRGGLPLEYAPCRGLPPNHHQNSSQAMRNSDHRLTRKLLPDNRLHNLIGSPTQLHQEYLDRYVKVHIWDCGAIYSVS